jgi:hypothetical protein
MATYEVPNSTNMIIEFFGKRDAGSDQAREALSEGMIELFNMISLTGFFTNGTARFARDNCSIVIGLDLYSIATTRSLP